MYTTPHHYVYCPSPFCILSLTILYSAPHHYVYCPSPFCLRPSPLCILSSTMLYTVLSCVFYHVFPEYTPLPLPSAYLLLPLRLPPNASNSATNSTIPLSRLLPSNLCCFVPTTSYHQSIQSVRVPINWGHIPCRTVILHQGVCIGSIPEYFILYLHFFISAF